MGHALAIAFLFAAVVFSALLREREKFALFQASYKDTDPPRHTAYGRAAAEEVYVPRVRTLRPLTTDAYGVPPGDMLGNAIVGGVGCLSADYSSSLDASDYQCGATGGGTAPAATNDGTTPASSPGLDSSGTTVNANSSIASAAAEASGTIVAPSTNTSDLSSIASTLSTALGGVAAALGTSTQRQPTELQRRTYPITY